MLLDARSLPQDADIEAEVCIVGGGAAGIAMAREFADTSLRVVLAESGAEKIEEDTQNLYAGSDVGRPYLDLTSCRLRYFGGTTNHWGGWCMPMDPVDFEAREGIPYSGWPFGREHLDPWYQRAQPICEVGPFDYALAGWGIAPDTIPAPFKGPHFQLKMLQESPPTRFGALYGPDLRRAERIAVYLNANAVGFDVNDAGAEVVRLRLATLSGVRFTIRARVYVLAAGGIENARLLLLSGPPDGPGLGNGRDLVGRFFAPHLVYSGGVIMLADPHTELSALLKRQGVRHPRSGQTASFTPFVGLTPGTMRARRLPAVNVFTRYEFAPVSKTILALKRILGMEPRKPELWDDVQAVLGDLGGVAEFGTRKVLFQQGMPVTALHLSCTSEQLPNPDSRIGLADERDALGLRRVAVNWHVSDADRRNAFEIEKLLGIEVGRTGLGRMRLSMGDNGDWPPDMYGDEHHIGTTRMHRDPAAGVVDADCRVHGIGNLYIAGSSVFPNCGSANPTLTIIALSLRLADHIRRRLA